MKFLTLKNYPNDQVARSVANLRDAVKAIHDVLEIAAHDKTEVAIVCRSISRQFRDEIWSAITGGTFGSQLKAAIDAGSRVRMLLANYPQDDAPLSKEILDLHELHRVKAQPSFSLLATGETEFWKTFPHFTIVRDNRQRHAMYLEVRPGASSAGDFKPEFLTINSPVEGYLLVRSPGVDDLGKGLLKQFDQLFSMAKSVAAQGVIAD